MGLIERTLGVGQAARAIGSAAEGVSEVFIPNATRGQELAAEIHRATLETAAAEFQHAGSHWFDRLINAINRLPRPALALGTIGLFTHAMIDPVSFAERMAGLQAVPEPLWWLLGAVVSFYFGARELHYVRQSGAGGVARMGRRGRRGVLARLRGRRRADGGAGSQASESQLATTEDNAALAAWHEQAHHEIDRPEGERL